MATYYVNKSGSDSNDGSTVDLAKLTVKAGVGLFGSGTTDYLYVGAGLYNEGDISIAARGNKYMYADGNVIMDGTGTTDDMFSGASSSSNDTIRFYPDPVNEGHWTFQNAPTSSSRYIEKTPGDFAIPSIYCVNCTFLASPSQITAIYISAWYTRAPQIGLTRCIFVGFTSGAQATSGSTARITATNCIFDSCVNGVLGYYLTLANNIISNCTSYGWYAYTSVTSTNNQYYNIPAWRLGGTTYSTLGEVQAAGKDAGSVEADPDYLDKDSKIFLPLTESPIARDQGVYGFGYTTGAANTGSGGDSSWQLTATADNTGWYNPDGNITTNVNNEFEFAPLGGATNGVMWSPVYDVGGTTVLRKVNIAGFQNYEFNMIDSDPDDVKPNYQTIELRISLTTFDQDNAVIAWSEYKQNIEDIALAGRYIQVRVTLRNDDVGA